MKRKIRIVSAVGIAAAFLLGLSTPVRQARAEGEMYIEICTSADCTPDGNPPPKKAAYFSAGTAKHFTHLWIGIWDKNKKKWVGNSLLFQPDYINDELIFIPCNKSLEFHSCDTGNFDCAKWNGKANQFVSPGSTVKVKC